MRLADTPAPVRAGGQANAAVPAGQNQASEPCFDAALSSDEPFSQIALLPNELIQRSQADEEISASASSVDQRMPHEDGPLP